MVAGALLLPVIHLYTVSTLNTVSTPMVEIHGCRAGVVLENDSSGDRQYGTVPKACEAARDEGHQS